MAPYSNKIFVPCRSLGFVSNHLPHQIRYIKNRKEHLIVTCVGKSFHTYGISHFGLLSVSGLHSSEITSITSDTYHVYTGCSNGIIYAWRRGCELKHTYKRHQKPVHLMTPFGIHLISIDTKNTIKIWEIKTESVYGELTFGDDFKISAIVHPSTYINKVVFASDSGGMQLWNINKLMLIYEFKGWPGSSITVLEQAPALDVIAIGFNSGRIVLHNLKYDETIMEFMQDYGLVTAISFRSDDHAIMVTGSTLGHLVFWDLDERKVSAQLPFAHDSSVTGITCLPNEPLVLTSSPDNTLKLWIFDRSDGDAPRLLRIREGHSATPNFVRFYNEHNIFSAAPDSTLRLFNTQTEQFNKSLGKASYNRKASKKRGRIVEDPLVMPPIVEFVAETTRSKEWDDVAAIHLGLPVVTSWSYNKVKMGNHKFLPERFQNKNKIREGYDGVSATCLCLTHCGNFVLIGYSSGHVDRFNMQSGLWRGSYGDPKAHERAVRGVSTDSLNQIVVTGGSEGTIKFWTFKKGLKELTVLDLENSIRLFRSHSSSSIIACALEDFSVILIDMDTRRVIRKFQGHSAQITDLSFSPDSRWLISASMDCSIRTWDIPSAQLIDQFATETACISLNMSPTSECLVTAHIDSLGLFLWTNRALYNKISFKSLQPSDDLQTIALPECQLELTDEIITDEDTETFISPEQISNDLATLSGLSTSRWQNLLNIDVIKEKNKPKLLVKKPKSAPFFLPTIASLDIQFNVTQPEIPEKQTKFLHPESLINLTEFGKLLLNSNFEAAIEKLKSFGPSMVNYEIKLLTPEAGGNVECMFQFLKCIEFMLKSNNNFELAESYLSVFLKEHGRVMAETEVLRNYLPNVQCCQKIIWGRLQEKLLYSICVVNNLKTM